MGEIMSKYTYIDLLIEVLLEHEKKMDELVTRLEDISPSLNYSIEIPDDPAIKNKVKRLESILDNYKNALQKVSSHCNLIDDKVCKGIIKDIELE
jgi:hypothetical protein